jgi:hypothetical protein
MLYLKQVLTYNATVIHHGECYGYHSLFLFARAMLATASR